MADTPLQTKKYKSAGSASTSHPVTLDFAVTPHSLVQLTVSYPGASGAQVSGLTDSGGEVWTADANLKTSNSVSVNGETWFLYNSVGGSKTITVNLSSSLNATIVVAEFPGVNKFDTSGNVVSPLDKAASRIHTPAAASQFRTSSTPAARSSGVEVLLGGAAWNSANITGAQNGTSWTTDVTEWDSVTNLGASILHRTLESLNRAGALAVASWRMTDAANTVPVAMMAGAFFREGVFPTADAADGSIQNIEGSVIVDTTSGYTFMSSPSAPFGGTGASEKTDQYAAPEVHLPAGATLINRTLGYLVADGYDDGLGFGFILALDDGDVNGASLDSGDEGRPAFDGVDATAFISLGTDSSYAGVKSKDLTGKQVNTNGRTSIRHSMSVDEASTGSYSHVADYSENTPMYIRGTVVWPAPAPAIRPRRLTRLANSPRLTLQRVRR